MVELRVPPLRTIVIAKAVLIAQRRAIEESIAAILPCHGEMEIIVLSIPHLVVRGIAFVEGKLGQLGQVVGVVHPFWRTEFQRIAGTDGGHLVSGTELAEKVRLKRAMLYFTPLNVLVTFIVAVVPSGTSHVLFAPAPLRLNIITRLLPDIVALTNSNKPVVAPCLLSMSMGTCVSAVISAFYGYCVVHCVF